MPWYFYIGIVAAICIAAYTLPQLLHVLKTKSTSDLSAIMLSLVVLGDLCFIIDGIGILADGVSSGDTMKGLSQGLPLILANSIAITISSILLGLKFRSLHYAKKFQTTEKQFCENYEAYKTKIRMAKAEKQAAKKVIVPPDEKPTMDQKPSSGDTMQVIG